MIQASIVGASGYTAAELAALLLKHPQVQLKHLAVRREPLPCFSELFPRFRGMLDQTCVPIDPQMLSTESDVLFLALPHKTTMELMPQFLEYASDDTLIIDLSGDYRLKDAQVYEQFYGQVHSDTANLEQFVYGLSECNRSQIEGSRRIANPGCYPTATLLALSPLVKSAMIELEDIVVDAKSGVSGAGKNPNAALHFPECHESFKAYKMGVHQHEPEMEQWLGQEAQGSVDLLFVPHLLPINRGIFSTIHGRLSKPISAADLTEHFQSFYEDSPFVRILPEGSSPELKYVQGTNFCDISISVVGQRFVICSAIDNLIKGASGQAVQNMNLALGFDQQEALL